MTLFSIVGILLFFVFNAYSYFSLARNFAINKLWWLLLIVFMLVFTFELAFFFRWSDTNIIAYKLGVYAIGFSFMSFCLLGITDLIALFFASRNKKEKARIRLIYDICVLFLLALYIGFGVNNALFNTQVTERNIKIKGLEKPLKAVMLSDLHIGYTLGRDFSQKIVDKIKELRPDMIFIVGDFIDTKAQRLGDMIEPFKELEAPIFYTDGNHEYYHGISPILRKLSELNISVLQNSSLNFAGLNIIGLSDISGQRFGAGADVKAAFSGIKENEPSILLTHQPKSIELLSPDELSKVSLVLSGHTHAGQIFPFSLLVWLAQGYIYGEYDVGENTKLVVSSGVGFWGPPMRILSNSEIVVLNLMPKN